MHEWYFLDGESTHRGQLSVRPSALHGYGLYTLEPSRPKPDVIHVRGHIVTSSPTMSIKSIYTKYPPLLPEYVHLMCKASIPIPNIETKPHRALSVLSWGTRREAGVMYSFFFFHTTLHHGSDGHTTGGRKYLD